MKYFLEKIQMKTPSGNKFRSMYRNSLCQQIKFSTFHSPFTFILFCFYQTRRVKNNGKCKSKNLEENVSSYGNLVIAVCKIFGGEFTNWIFFLRTKNNKTMNERKKSIVSKWTSKEPCIRLAYFISKNVYIPW